MGDRSSPECGDSHRLGRPRARRTWRDALHTGPRRSGRGRPGLIDRRALLAALDHAAEKQVTMISAPAGSGKTSLLRAWADRPGPDRRIAFTSVRPSQHDAQLFWLALLGAVRAAAGTDGDAEPPPVTPGSGGAAVRDKVLSELTAVRGPFFLVIDDLHELTSAEAVEQLADLLTRLPPGVHAVVATRRDPPLRPPSASRSGPPPTTSRSPSTSRPGCRMSSRSTNRSSTRRAPRWTGLGSS
ncbi:AAA family ATPase [Streptomyces sp. NPDC059467]|uniref:AAA family ATPase n=1 Tax=Streptomyces sp. NPDC059467 TaxID=3346844 RepID=UPI0036A26900